MTLHRRDFLASSLAIASATALPRLAVASTPVGTGTLTTISDGHLTLPRSFVLGPLAKTEAAPILTQHGITGDTVQSPCNVTLYQDADRTVLFDVGSGSDFMPTAGELLDSLDAAGHMPEDITHVVFTHAHPDHLWGLLDDFGDAAFAEAEFLIGKDEWDYWLNPNTIDQIGEARQGFAVGAKWRLETIADQITFFKDGEEILPGIAALATYGHTPGHMSFQIGADDPVVVIGDAIGNAHVSFANPSWQIGSDQAPDQAAATRAALMDSLATAQSRIIGYHLPRGGLGRVARAKSGYQFVGADQ